MPTADPGALGPACPAGTAALDTGGAPRKAPAVRTSLLLLAAAPLCAACSSPTPLSLIITAGQEADAFTACGVVTVTVQVKSLDGSIDISDATLHPGSTFDFGELDATQQVSVTVTGFD